jgi:hypothetical protein
MKNLKEAKLIAANHLRAAFMNIEYLQDAEGILTGYHPLLGNYSITAEEMVTMYLNLFKNYEDLLNAVEQFETNLNTVEGEKNGQKSIS